MDINIRLMVVLTKLNNVFLSKLGKNLEGLGMQMTTYAMLAHLNKQGREKTQRLGEVALVTSGTITHLVNKMIKDKLVIKIQDEEDKRVYWVQITDHGSNEFEKVHVEHMKFLRDLLKDFSEIEKEEFIKQIKYFGKTLSKKNK